MDLYGLALDNFDDARSKLVHVVFVGEYIELE